MWNYVEQSNYILCKIIQFRLVHHPELDIAVEYRLQFTIYLLCTLLHIF
jgi:hypothetical protein